MAGAPAPSAAAGSGGDDPSADVDGYEATDHVLFRCDWVAIYSIPPRRSAAGVRAEEWDVEKWQFVRAMRVVMRGSQCVTVLEDADTKELFVEAPGGLDAVEPVVDSSRYFVLRVSAGDRKAFLGIGFRQREHASDFLAALSEANRWLRQEKEAEALAKEIEALPTEALNSGKFKMKEGETIKIKAKFKPETSEAAKRRAALKAQLAPPSPGTSTTGIPLVAPPAGGFPAWVTNSGIGGKSGAPKAAMGLTPPPRAPGAGAPAPAAQQPSADAGGWASFDEPATAAAVATQQGAPVADRGDFEFDDDAFGDFEEAADAPAADEASAPTAGSHSDDGSADAAGGAASEGEGNS